MIMLHLKSFQKSSLHPNANLIKGVICGYRVEEIENPFNPEGEIPR